MAGQGSPSIVMNKKPVLVLSLECTSGCHHMTKCSGFMMMWENYSAIRLATGLLETTKNVFKILK